MQGYECEEASSRSKRGNGLACVFIVYPVIPKFSWSYPHVTVAVIGFLSSNASTRCPDGTLLWSDLCKAPCHDYVHCPRPPVRCNPLLYTPAPHKTNISHLHMGLVAV